MDLAEREMGLLAEMALGADSLSGFEMQWIEHLRDSIGFDTACSVWTDNDGSVQEVTSVGYDGAALRQRFPLYMGELSTSEVAAFSASQPVIDTDVVSSRRRQQLAVYRELLAPLHISSFVTNVWRSRWGVFGFHFARARPTSMLTSREASWLGRLAPSIKLGQALLAAQRSPHVVAAGGFEQWSKAWGLSTREAEVARLVARGFSNPEVAALLRVSRHTVRNQLVSVFRKAEVSSRAELVFAMTSPLEPHWQRQSARRQRRDAWRTFVSSPKL